MDLFPFPTIRFGDLDPHTQLDIRSMLNLSNIDKGELIQPSKRTMQMGFTWADTLAHNATTNIIRKAYEIATCDPVFRELPHSLKMFRKAYAPFNLEQGIALSLDIIDEISIVACGWPEAALVLL